MKYNRHFVSCLLQSPIFIDNPTHFFTPFSFQKDDKSNARISGSSRSRTEEPHIGKYRLIKTIGKGNFAKVKLAKHVPTGREVCNNANLLSVMVCWLSRSLIVANTYSVHCFLDLVYWAVICVKQCSLYVIIGTVKRCVSYSHCSSK